MKAFKKISALMAAVTLVTMTGFTGIASAADKYNNLILESLYFTDDDDMVITEPDGYSDIYPNVCIQKDESDTPFEGSIIVAVYKDGALVGTNSFEAEDTELTGETVFGFDRSVFRGPAMDIPEGSSAKVFFWESEESMIPYDEPAAAVPGFDDRYYGELTFPEPFASLVSGFEITKEPGVRNYSNTATPYNTYDWSDATEIFLSTDVNYLGSGVSERLGTDRNEPITGRNFAAQYKAGAYTKADGSKQTKFIFTLLNDFYSGSKSASGQNVHSIPLNNFGLNAALNLGEGEAIDALVRSGSESGFTWMGTLIKQDDASWITQQWTLEEGYENVYSTVKNSSENVLTLFNFENTDAYGLPRPYVLVNSVEEVEAAEGTFYQDTSNKGVIYCHPRSGESLADIDLVAEDSFLSGVRHNGAYSNNTLMFENIGFVPRITAHNNNVFYGKDYDKSIFGFFGCKFSGGANNTISLDGRYTAYMVDCVAGYGFRDGFNYHGMENDVATINADGRSSTVIELNCTAYMVGDYNRITNAPNINHDSGLRTDNSNNASTVHDNMKCLRIGGRYWGTQGPIIGDGAYEITMGTEAYDINPTPSDKVAFGITSDLLNSYVIDCYATGTNIRSGVNANDTSYILDYCGNSRITKGGSGNLFTPSNVITWDDIANGVWHTIKTMTVSGLKTEYSVGESLDLSGAKLVLDYDDGRQEEVELTDPSIMVTGFDSSTAGDKTITIAYKSLAVKFDISVIEREIESIELSGIKTEYTVGQEFDDATGFLVVNYSDGGSEEILLSNPNVQISGFDTSSAGTKTITVTFRDKSTTAQINVAERTLTGFTLEGVKTEYALRDAFDTETGKIIASYDNGTTAEIALSADGVEISGFDTETTGEKTVTVSYMGFSQSYNINVVSRLYAKHYNIFDDISADQGENCWYYRYAQVGTYGLSAYRDYTNYNATDRIWSMPASQEYTYGRIRMNNSVQALESGNLGDAALFFEAPAPGTIKISMQDGTIKDGGNSLDIQRFRIYKNDEQIFPAEEGTWLIIEGYQGSYNETYGTSYPNEVEFEPITITVEEGDKIIFRANKGSDELSNTNPEHANNSGDKLVCIPQIDYVDSPEEPDPDPDPQPGIDGVTVKQVFNFAEDFSDTQGENNWYYLSAARNTNDYAEMPLYEKYAYYSAIGWKYASDNYAYGIINNNYTSSGYERDPVLGFRAPIGGNITISIPDGLRDAGQGSENTDGVNFNIYKVSADGGRTKLFPQGEDEFYEVPRTLGSETVTPFEPISVDVEAGDYIYFRVNMKQNSANDNLFYSPVIEYNSDIGVYLDDSYLMLDIEDGVPVSEQLTYSGTADSVSFESSNPDAVEVSADGTLTPVAAGSAYVTLEAAAGDNTYKTSVLVDVVNKKNPIPFADGDVIGMWGDSLTHGGNYAERIEEFYASKYPDITIDIPKFGYSGDDTVDIINRIQRDINTRPDLTRATILIGANDFALTPAKVTGEYATYTDRMNIIIDTLKSNGITDITLITPTPFDAIRSGNNLRAGLMEEFSYDLRKIASDNDCAIVDAWSLMEQYDAKLKEGHEVSPTMPSLMSDDNLHPSDQGYMVLAYSILKAQGVLLTEADAPKAEISAGSELSVVSNENSVVAELGGTADSFSFSYTPDTLAYPKNTGFVEFAALEDALSGEFAEGGILKISGLEADAEYDLSIDGSAAATLTGAELAAGISLSGFDAVKAKSDKLTEIVDLIDNYDDSLVGILNVEWRYLGATDVLTAEEGIALAEQKKEDGSLNEGTANSYITWKNSEENYKLGLADEWDNLCAAAADRTISVGVAKKGEAPEIANHYNVFEDITQDQGHMSWYYRFWNHYTSAYEEYNRCTDGNTWNTNGSNANGQIRMQPGNQVLEAGSNGDSALTFKAPKSGTIVISMAGGTAAEENIIKEAGSLDLSRFRILKNEEQIYPLAGSGEEWLVLTSTLSTYNQDNGTDYPTRVTFEPITLEVEEGDEIIFVVNKGGYGSKAECGFNNDGDKVTCIPQIDYIGN